MNYSFLLLKLYLVSINIYNMLKNEINKNISLILFLKQGCL